MVIDVSNLIGDTLYTLRPLAQHFARNGYVNTKLVASPGIPFEMVRGTFPLVDVLREAPEHVDLRLSAGDAAKYASENKYKDRVAFISEAFSLMMAIEPDNDIFPLTQWAQLPTEEFFKKKYISIAPFSRSCTRHITGIPNKTLDDWKWAPIISYLRRFGYELRVLCGPGERLEHTDLSEDEYYTSGCLLNLERVLKESAFLVSIDTGVAHIASALKIPTIIFWPAASYMQFIGPAYSMQTDFIQMPRNLAKLPTAAIMGPLRQLVRRKFDAFGKNTQDASA